MKKKGMTWNEVIFALLAAFILFFLFTAWGAPIVKLVKDIGVKMNMITPEPETPDTYAICDPLKTVIVTVDSPANEDPNAFFTYGWNAIAKKVDIEEIILRFSPPLDQSKNSNEIVKLFVSKNIIFKPTGETEWKEYTGIYVPTFKVVGGVSEISITGIPEDYILLEFTDEQVSGTRRICKSQRQISMEVDT